MIVAVDFDGTIVKESVDEFFDSGGFYVGEVIDGAIPFLKYLREEGHLIVIFTARMNPENKKALHVSKSWLEKQLIDRGIPFDEVYTSPGKPYADVFIDDRALSFKGDWLETWGEFMEIEKNAKTKTHN